MKILEKSLDKNAQRNTGVSSSVCTLIAMTTDGVHVHVYYGVCILELDSSLTL